MFDFEKFEVYQKARRIAKDISELIVGIKGAHPRIIDQLQRASLSIPLNIAEGAGRYSRADKKNFYIIARGSVFECVAILDIISDVGLISQEEKAGYYEKLEGLSKMVSGLINSQRQGKSESLHSSFFYLIPPLSPHLNKWRPQKNLTISEKI